MHNMGVRLSREPKPDWKRRRSLPSSAEKSIAAWVIHHAGRDMRLSPEVLATLKQVVPCLTARVSYAQLQSRLNVRPAGQL